jgi:anti-sigma factor RsiW
MLMDTRRDPPDEPMVARDATYYRAPDALRERIRATIAADGFERPAPPRARARPAWWGWMGGAAMAAAAAALSWNVALMQVASREDDGLAREVTSAHVRSLMLANHLNDVASTDQHTVKPWFEGKIDFAPRVEELSSCGFPLLGGRLDYLDGRAVAAMTYRRRLHVVNLFEWPATRGAAELQVMNINGYSIARWSDRGLQYWAVSDVADADIREFARCLRGA